MTRFIEYTNKQGCRLLVSLNLVNSVIDKNKEIIVYAGEESITLAISYNTFKAWLLEGDKSPILSAGSAL
jgi:hypothetical protein